MLTLLPFAMVYLHLCVLCAFAHSSFPALEQAHNATLRQRANALRDAFFILIEQMQKQAVDPGNCIGSDAGDASAGPTSVNAAAAITRLRAPLPADRGRLQAWILDAQLAFARACGLDLERKWTVEESFGAPSWLASLGTDAELIERSAWDSRKLSTALIPAVRSSRDGLGEAERYELGREQYTWCDLVVDAGRSPRPRGSERSSLGNSLGSSLALSSASGAPTTPCERREMAASSLAAARANLGLSVPACARGPFAQ